MKRSTDYLDTPSPVVGLADEYPAGFVDPMHFHERAQLLYASSGVMSVATPQTSYVVPPQRAVWLPAHLPHEVSCRGAVSVRTLYIDTVHDAGSDGCRLLQVSDFLRALILEVVGFQAGYAPASREGRITSLLLEECARMPNAPYQAAMPQDPRLLRVCRSLLVDPADTRDIDAWATHVGMSRRSFTRAFRDELGMGFAQWRQQIRLLSAISLLAEGRSITSVALDVGYESPSAFTATFHRAFGQPPSAYMAR